MDLLLGNTDTNTIRLIRRWRSNKILRYLHVTARPLIQGHSETMLASGDHR